MHRSERKVSPQGSLSQRTWRDGRCELGSSRCHAGNGVFGRVAKAGVRCADHRAKGKVSGKPVLQRKREGAESL